MTYVLFSHSAKTHHIFFGVPNVEQSAYFKFQALKTTLCFFICCNDNERVRPRIFVDLNSSLGYRDIELDSFLLLSNF